MALEGTVLTIRSVITLFKNIKPLEFGGFIMRFYLTMEEKYDP